VLVLAVSRASATARAHARPPSSFSWQQRLYFCPLRSGTDSLRPILILGSLLADFTKEEEKRCGSNHTERAERHPILRAAAGLDREIADAAHASHCHKCDAKLHWGSFARKPRGVPVGLGPEHLQRFSLCCAADGCRSRDTPSSLRFPGRKVFLGLPWWC